MPSLSELREELKTLRKASLGHAPVSRMRKGDISSQIEHLKGMRAETPAAAAVPSVAHKATHSAVETIKEAKHHEFPVAPHAPTKHKRAAAPAKVEKKASKGMSKAALRAMLDELSSDSE